MNKLVEKLLCTASMLVFAVSFSLVTNNVSAQPVPAISGTGGLSVVTDNGGAYYNLQCRSDEVLVGVYGYALAYIDQIGPVCVQASPEGKWIGEPKNRGSVGFLVSFLPYREVCPKDSAVSSVKGNVFIVITRFTLSCRELGNDYSLVGSDHDLKPIGGFGGKEEGPFACPDMAAKGIHGQYTSSINAIGLSCKAKDMATKGLWSEVIPWPHIATSMANLPDGRIITWSGYLNDGFVPQFGAQFTQSAVFNPADQSFKQTNNLHHDTFCSGISLMEDGTIMVTGGNRFGPIPFFPVVSLNRLVSFFSINNDRWETPYQYVMEYPRWYGTQLTLSNGEVMTTFADGAEEFPEVFTPNQGWTTLTDAPQTDLINEQNGNNSEQPANDSTNLQWYAYMHVAPDGRVFHSGPSKTMHWIDPQDTGDIQAVNNGGNALRDIMFGNAVMYDVGKILLIGGNDRRQQEPATNRVVSVDVNTPDGQLTVKASMQYSRVYQNSVVLPTGEVLVSGGNSSGVLFSDEGTRYTPEVWDPQADEWTSLAAMAVPRNYHSTAILLQDARVLTAGSGLCSECETNHHSAQIYTPPYLFNSDGSLAQRPKFIAAPSSAYAGDMLNVQTSEAASKFSLLRLTSTTHGINTDQRFMNVEFTNVGGDQYELALNDNPNVLVPGYYWLFALNQQNVPSVGHLIHISNEAVLDRTTLLGSPNSSASAYEHACDSDEVLVGVRGYTFFHLGRLKGVCSKVSDQGKWEGDLSLLPTIASGGVFSQTRLCPENHAVVGISGKATLALGVNELTLQCKALNGQFTVNGAPVTTSSLKGFDAVGDTLGPYYCMSDKAAIGMYGIAGAKTDALGLLCSH